MVLCPISARAIHIDPVVDHAFGTRDDVGARVIDEQSKPAEVRADGVTGQN